MPSNGCSNAFATRATMGKVVCIHGTESGGSERHAKRLSKSWPKANFDQSKDFMSGNDAASVGLEELEILVRSTEAWRRRRRLKRASSIAGR